MPTLRDLFAAAALIGLTNGRKAECAIFADEAYRVADAMLVRRKETPLVPSDEVPKQ